MNRRTCALAHQFHNLAVELADLPLDGGASFEQRPDRSHQLRTALDQFLGSHDPTSNGSSQHASCELKAQKCSVRMISRLSKIG
jgi:hypothetical protein